MSPKRRRACDIMGFRAGCYPRAAQTESSNWQYQLIFLICYNTGKKGKSATWTLAQIRKTWQPWNGPDFPVSIGSGVGVGRRYFAFAKTGSPPGFLCVRVCVGGALRGRQSLGLLSCFLGIRSPPFHCRPIWKRNVQHDDRGCPHVGEGRK